MKEKYDVVIVGSGVSGLYAALQFSEDISVLVISKRDLSLSNSSLAQGGVAAVIDKDNDNYKLHIADTLIAGGYKNDLSALEQVEAIALGGSRAGENFDEKSDCLKKSALAIIISAKITASLLIMAIVFGIIIFV